MGQRLPTGALDERLEEPLSNCATVSFGGEPPAISTYGGE